MKNYQNNTFYNLYTMNEYYPSTDLNGQRPYNNTPGSYYLSPPGLYIVYKKFFAKAIGSRSNLPLLATLDEPFHPEGLAVPGIDGVDGQAPQPFEAGILYSYIVQGSACRSSSSDHLNCRASISRTVLSGSGSIGSFAVRNSFRFSILLVEPTVALTCGKL